MLRLQFRSLLRQSSQFSNYNFREYALRRTKDAFREHQKEHEERKIQEFIQDGLKNLRMMKVGLHTLDPFKDSRRRELRSKRYQQKLTHLAETNRD